MCIPFYFILLIAFSFTGVIRFHGSFPLRGGQYVCALHAFFCPERRFGCVVCLFKPSDNVLPSFHLLRSMLPTTPVSLTLWSSISHARFPLWARNVCVCVSEFHGVAYLFCASFVLLCRNMVDLLGGVKTLFWGA